MSVSRRILSVLRSGAAKAVADQGLVSIANFLTTVAMARTLTVRDFGIYSLLFVAMTNVNGLLNTLISEPTRVLGVRKDGRVDAVYATTQLVINATLGMLVAGVAFSVLHLLLGVNCAAALGVSAAILFVGTQEVVRALNAAGHRWRNVLASDVVCHGIKLTLLAALMLSASLRVDTAFWALAFGAAAGTAVYTLAGAKLQMCAPGRFRAELSRNWNYGKWLLLESIVFIASVNVYLYLTALLMDVESAGALNAAQTLVNSANVLWMGITAFSIPAARRILIEHGSAGWKKYLCSVGVGIVALTAGVGVVLSLFARPLLTLVFSPEYAGYAYLIPILAAAMVLTVCNAILSVAFRTLDLPRVGFEANLVSALATSIAAYPAIKYWGVAGAAGGLILTQLCWFAVYLKNLMALRPVFGQQVARVLSQQSATEALLVSWNRSDRR